MNFGPDPLASFFLVSFGAGFALTVASFVMGFGHVAGDGAGGHLDIGEPGTGGHVGPSGGGQLDLGGEAGTGDLGGPTEVGDASLSHHAHAHPTPAHGPSPFNYTTAVAFLTWFGGAGFVLRRFYSSTAVLALVAAAVAGLVGGGAVWAFLAKVLSRGQRIMNPEDYRLPGTVGRVPQAMRPGGTGEVVYSQGGSRKVLPARHVRSEPLAPGTEVVILDVREGIAYVDSVADYTRELSVRMNEERNRREVR